jgi:Integrase core domain
MNQVARNLSDSAEGFLLGKRYLIHERDPLFTEEFVEILKSAGERSVKLPPRSPNLNAHAERFVRTIKESCLERIILLAESSLRKAIHEFSQHYHHERNHQGPGNRLIMPEQKCCKQASSAGEDMLPECKTIARHFSAAGTSPRRSSSSASAGACASLSAIVTWKN